jgi:hypothetical protein
MRRASTYADGLIGNSMFSSGSAAFVGGRRTSHGHSGDMSNIHQWDFVIPPEGPEALVTELRGRGVVSGQRLHLTVAANTDKPEEENADFHERERRFTQQGDLCYLPEWS